MLNFDSFNLFKLTRVRTDVRSTNKKCLQTVFIIFYLQILLRYDKQHHVQVEGRRQQGGVETHEKSVQRNQ